MTKKTRRKFIAEAKAKAVADYVAGTRTALQMAKDLGVEVHSRERPRTRKNVD